MAELPKCILCGCAPTETGAHKVRHAVHGACPINYRTFTVDEWNKLMGQGEAVAERAPKAPGGINWLCDVLPERGAKLYLYPAPAEDDAVLRDAARYRWLREQHWHDGRLAVVTDPKTAVKLGRFCPSGSMLDSVIDIEMKDQSNENAG